MKSTRCAAITRKTAETDISLTLNLDGTGRADIDSGVPFLDHMLTLFCSHGRFDLTLRCKGDTAVDDHHSAEDIGIALGDAIRQALGDKRGILRYGSMLLPMDEALILCAIDLSGRAHLSYELTIPAQKIGSFDTELGREFFLALTQFKELCQLIQNNQLNWLILINNTFCIIDGIRTGEINNISILFITNLHWR